MNQDYSKAVSFVNSYFVLADGLVSGFENCLSENVVLDWFGKTIKGKNNVAAFMNTHKVKSRHVFNDISPADSIGYKKKSNRRHRRRRSKNPNNSLNSGDISIENRLSFESTPVNESAPINVSSTEKKNSSTKIDAEGNHIEEHDLTLELHDDDPSTLFKLEYIKSTNVEEIEQKISQMCLEEKLNMKSPKKWDYKEVKSENIGIIESSMKFVEAHGEILFSKKSRRQSDWNECKLISSNSMQTWRKPCKLQIAYSSQQICLPQVLSGNNNTTELQKSSSDESQKNILSLDEIAKISSQLVPNVNDFSGYLRNMNFIKEEDSFLKTLNNQLSNNEASKLGLIPHYVNGQLVFQKMNSDDQNDFQSSFIFNHLIHLIIYEGISRCRMNLSQKFNQ